ncbi:hypothetical protein VHA01S_031_00590 [Vibrio halioticoli NBRC 102217]|uniref:DUF262 domain-containing protein n=1 Tax=Vibrio halioticoli NBRC 102217 TaxID=1219072 RepID=V5FMH5_9VIBR|nr:DUF262 domain-containing protein [Vibrio halioticoli]GAD90047.1 hypothetical protein VHA01S_031_00590 [Vibrio halioticoli NBRC 102217]
MNPNNNLSVDSLSVEALLSDSNEYVIPMYQRNYAWGEGEINQLILDVKDYQKKVNDKGEQQPYYIGTLVVFERAKDKLEVIDGQQRFTTLTLIAICLYNMSQSNDFPSLEFSRFTQPNLDFESRPKSSNTIHTLANLGSYDGKSLAQLKTDDYNQDIIQGYELIKHQLETLGNELNDFYGYLFKFVKIYRVPVPPKTDLNHYFEVMNNRGEQLEKHEILKAKMMSALQESQEDTKEQSIELLTKVWDATANMERYVQYGFKRDERAQIFGSKWGGFELASFDELLDIHTSQPIDSEKNVSEMSMADMLTTVPTTNGKQGVSQQRERFNSISNFSNFLLHVLRVWTGKDIPLDDKQLLEQFDEYVFGKKRQGESLDQNTSAKNVREFIFALLKCKYLFDKYIIKREYSQNGNQWSLKRLYCYDSGSESYLNTFGDEDKEDTSQSINRRTLMLLAAFHVSTPTMVYKHWLNGALNILYSMESINAEEYLKQLESMARSFVFKRYLNESLEDYYSLIYSSDSENKQTNYSNFSEENLKYGNIKNNLVFNYLDYLLWCDNRISNINDTVIEKFEFTFRSSVEHFYPQHPLDGHTELNEADLHNFGNLCLISHSKNSKLSNVQPAAKCDHFAAAIANKSIDSLKLYKMINQVKESSWEKEKITDHAQSMLNRLRADAALI